MKLNFITKYLKPRYSLGISIQEQNIVLVEIKNEEKTYISKLLKVSMDEFFDEKKRKVVLRKLHTHDVYVSVSTFQVLQKTVLLPYSVNDKDMFAYFNSRIDHYFPEIKESLRFSLQRLLPFDTEKPKVHVLAVRDDEIKRIETMIDLLGFTMIAIEPDSHALLRLVMWYDALLGKKAAHDQILGAIFYSKDGFRILVFNEEQLLYDRIYVSIAESDLSHIKNELKISEQLTVYLWAPKSAVAVYDLFYNQCEKSEKNRILFKQIEFNLCESNETCEIDDHDILAFGLALRGIE